jgi:hypothetical protein
MDGSWVMHVLKDVGHLTDLRRFFLTACKGNDSIGGWNPQPVTSTIEFRGKKVHSFLPFLTVYLGC